MMNTLTVGLGIALSLGTAWAQPAPSPDPTPAPTPPPAPPPPKEKASGESLQASTGGDRPWAAGVSKENQEKALQLFREGNTYHNDGLFKKAVELYDEALKSWDHPAINYNL